jgi:hypothetical protein
MDKQMRFEVPPRPAYPSPPLPRPPQGAPSAFPNFRSRWVSPEIAALCRSLSLARVGASRTSHSPPYHAARAQWTFGVDV